MAKPSRVATRPRPRRFVRTNSSDFSGLLHASKVTAAKVNPLPLVRVNQEWREIKCCNSGHTHCPKNIPRRLSNPRRGGAGEGSLAKLKTRPTAKPVASDMTTDAKDGSDAAFTIARTPSRERSIRQIVQPGRWSRFANQPAPAQIPRAWPARGIPSSLYEPTKAAGLLFSLRSCCSQARADPVAPPCSAKTFAIAGRVSSRAQSRCHSPASAIQVMGTMPA